jgi:phage gp36-like protein
LASQQYVVEQDFFDLTLPQATFGNLTDIQINKALLWASAQADGFLNKRFALPLVDWSEDLEQAVADIAAYRLMKRRGFRPDSGNDITIADAHKDALDWLLKVSRGDVVPAGIVDSTPAVDEEGSLATSNKPLSFRTFTGGRGRQ